MKTREFWLPYNAFEKCAHIDEFKKRSWLRLIAGFNLKDFTFVFIIRFYPRKVEDCMVNLFLIRRCRNFEEDRISHNLQIFRPYGCLGFAR